MTSKEKTSFRRRKEWREFRKGFLERNDSCCELCGSKYFGKSKRKLQLHHKNVDEYTNLKNIGDFVLLCSSCHDLVERMSKKIMSEKAVIYNRSKWVHLLYNVVSYKVKRVLDNEGEDFN